MIIIKRIVDLVNYLSKTPGPVGFVPTMGALHQGHLQLIKEARKQSNTVVCSIFVNPTQFNDKKDFEKYPITLDADMKLLESIATDFLFLPDVSELYPNGTSGLENYDLGYLETVFEGASRPGHFQGVCQVMFRLLSAVNPSKVFMGQKDYQQCMVVSRLLVLTGIKISLITCETIREEDGLAMSSRNRRLNKTERQNAIGIFEALQHANSFLKQGNLEVLKNEAKKILLHHDFKIDYVEIANKNTLECKTDWNGSESLVMLIAAYQGEVRLIDNMIIYPNQQLPKLT